MEVTPEGTFATDENGNQVLIFGVPTVEVITLSDLMNSLEAINQKEGADRASTVSFLSQTTSSLREPLVQWAGLGFPNAYILMTVELSPPSKCSDGVVRNMAEYIVFLTGKTIQDWFVDMNTKVSGLRLEPSLPNGSIQIWVYKSV